ncbi:MAG: rod-binding protein [Candidatus Muirbacterium halophilum]|nr:rod-binding protein [Candidatus Muirbacterium halophilum]MCK9474826.1 rod-binding protein [Candidatus Muirbacterium halophilum]
MNIDFSSLQNNDITKMDNLKDRFTRDNSDEKLKKSCQDFESIFVNQLMKSMRSTVQKTGFISGGRGEEIFQSMLDEEYSNEISKSGKMGLAEIMFKELSKKL